MLGQPQDYKTRTPGQPIWTLFKIGYQETSSEDRMLLCELSLLIFGVCGSVGLF
jgi:hypothetical protein